jgi:hypothetical protein
MAWRSALTTLLVCMFIVQAALAQDAADSNGKASSEAAKGQPEPKDSSQLDLEPSAEPDKPPQPKLMEALSTACLNRRRFSWKRLAPLWSMFSLFQSTHLMVAGQSEKVGCSDVTVRPAMVLLSIGFQPNHTSI